MAASSGANVRVRLNFDDSCRYVCESAISKSFWYLVDLERLKTIEDFALEICSRFDIGCNLRVELSLDGCLLPQWETTAILRDNDLVSVAAVEDKEEAVSKKRKSSGSDWKSSVTSENNRKNKEKKRRASEEGEENDVAPITAVPKTKKRRNEVKSSEIVEADVVRFGGTDGSKEKRRNRKEQDTEAIHLSGRQADRHIDRQTHIQTDRHLSDLPYDANSVQSSTAVKSRSCFVTCSENLTLEPNRLRVEEMGTDGVHGNEQTDRSPLAGVSASAASAFVEDERGFGANVLVSSQVEEANCHLHEVGLAIGRSQGEVKKKAKRTRRSRKNRKEKNQALLDAELKSNDSGFPRPLELPPNDVQKVSFQWQKTDLPWSKTSAYSHPQHVVFDGDDEDPGARAPFGQNVFADGLPNCSKAERAESFAEGLIGSKDEMARADKDLSRAYEPPKMSCDPVVHNEEQTSQLSETTGTVSIAGSPLEVSSSVEGRGYRCQLMHANSNPRDLSHKEKPREMRSSSDLSPFANVKVYKRQRGARFQSPSSAEPVLTSKGNQVQTPTCTKRQKSEDILSVTTSAATRDYSKYELLLGPPRPGDVIAYKILQLSDDYSPGLSSYKEAKVLKFTPSTRIVEIEPKSLQIPGQVKKSTGRFDLTIEDDNEILTNSLVEDDKLISLSWDLVLEPRLVA